MFGREGGQPKHQPIDKRGYYNISEERFGNSKPSEEIIVDIMVARSMCNKTNMGTPYLLGRLIPDGNAIKNISHISPCYHNFRMFVGGGWNNRKDGMVGCNMTKSRSSLFHPHSFFQLILQTS